MTKKARASLLAAAVLGVGYKVALAGGDGLCGPYQFVPASSPVSTTQYTFDGIPARVSDPSDFAVTFSYDAIGNVIESTAGQQPGSAFTYADVQTMTGSTASPAITTTTYDADGDVLAMPSGDGSNTVNSLFDRTITQYDAAGDVLTESRYSNMASTNIVTTTTTTYDTLGRQSTTTDALGNITTTMYDGLSTRSQVVTGSGSLAVTTTYDSVGNQIQTVDPLGRVTTYMYDAGNTRTQSMTSSGLTTYDSNGNQLATTDPLGNVTTYTYDSNRTSTLSPSNTYDSAGNVISTIDAQGQVTTYMYDSNRTRMQTITDPLGVLTTTSYDSAGNQVQTIDPLGGVTTYMYDSNSTRTQTPSNTQTLSDATGTMIDPRGRVTTYQYESDYAIDRGLITTYTYDLEDIITAPGGLVTTYQYDYSGSVIPQLSLGLITTYAYDYNWQLLSSLGQDTTDMGTATLSVQAVPDPTGVSLLALGAIPMLLRRKRDALPIRPPPL